MGAVRFGPYRLERLLGKGGMGEVWLAATSTGHHVALKLLAAEHARDATYRLRFEREAELATALRDPHIVPIHAHGAIDGRLFIEMAYVDGTDLAARLACGELPVATAIDIVGQVAGALDTAHGQGLVHRDIKPSNILVRPDGFSYLIDFGLARSLGTSGLTVTGMAIGTLAYMAPERFTSTSCDARADVYSLACVLYECLTGARPFGDTDPAQQMHAHLMSSPPRAAVRNRTIPPALDQIIAKGMAKEPADRYASAGEFAAAARAALAEISPPRPNQSAPTPTKVLPQGGLPPTRVETVLRGGAVAASPGLASAGAESVGRGRAVAPNPGSPSAGAEGVGRGGAVPSNRGLPPTRPEAVLRSSTAEQSSGLPPTRREKVAARPSIPEAQVSSGRPATKVLPPSGLARAAAVVPAQAAGQQVAQPVRAPGRRWYLRRHASASSARPAAPVQPVRPTPTARATAVRRRGQGWPSRGPGYAAPPPRPARRRKKGGFLRKMIGALVLLVVAPFALAAGCFALIAASSPNSSDTGSAVDKPPAIAEGTPEPVPDEAPESDPGPAPAGSAVRDGKFEFAVTDVESGISRVGVQSAQGSFLLVTLSVRNISAEPKWFVPFGQKLVDSAGHATEHDATATIWKNTSRSHGYSFELTPGQSATVVLVFDVAAESTPAHLELHDFVLSGGVSVALT
ncbi:serine/threonine-protein kinase [Nocardia goodfellowii]|uniref:non-specific serine/threonine protein kinase n=1 Tax=Nocardia goodfellowii TaxID=882446 RepID=A0ABS4Q7T0_9NOCA|nr:serine/threonine-protein kinase [Nocardia goodfellowii]MBP2187190.1 serine/threonine-protein kinase [Nocardia goodfellowii]